MEGHDLLVEELLEVFLVEFLVCGDVSTHTGRRYHGKIGGGVEGGWDLQSNSKYSGSSEDTAGSSSGSCCGRGASPGSKDSRFGRVSSATEEGREEQDGEIESGRWIIFRRRNPVRKNKTGGMVRLDSATKG